MADECSPAMTGTAGHDRKAIVADATPAPAT